MSESEHDHIRLGENPDSNACWLQNRVRGHFLSTLYVMGMVGNLRQIHTVQFVSVTSLRDPSMEILTTLQYDPIASAQRTVKILKI